MTNNSESRARESIAVLQKRLDSALARERAGQESRDALLAMLEDLQESQYEVEKARREWASAMDAMRNPVFMHNSAGRIVRANLAYAACAGMDIRQIIGKPYWQLFPKGDGPLPACAHELEQGEIYELEQQLPSGQIYITRFFPIRDDEGNLLYSLHVMEDITERKRMEVEMRQKSEELQEAQRISHTGNWVLDTKTGIVTWSAELYRIFGRDPAVPAPTLGEHTQILTPESITQLNTAIEKTLQTEEPYEIDLELIHPSGSRRWIAARGEVGRDASSQNVELHGTARDITERKEAELAVQHANRALATLSAVNRNLVHASNEKELLQTMCQVVVETGGYYAAWVGYKQDDTEKTLRPMAQFGFETGYVESLQITWADSEPGQGPSGKAVRSGRVQVVQEVANDPGCIPCKDGAWKHDNASAIALPIFDGADTQGCLTICAAQANAFDPEEVALLEEMAEDMSFGIHMLRLREKQKQQTVLLRKSLEGTVLAIAGMVEMRDPYTAGHQVRVAGLAVAIARQMGLSAEKVHGIHLAGTVHDLGKIQVPAEILSKPGKLSDIEYSLIKAHPQAGYDILKDIDFPWPIAQIVLQHHERMDGSGYPQGLRGDAILPEARIIAVADVVEAMSSHRPYRPGLGIEAALAEITKNCGTWYDPQAVDTCLSLFRDKAYRFA